MNKITRRDLLRYSALGFATVVVSNGLTGCSEDNATDTFDVSFTHSVASGDPLVDRVIIWTRVAPAQPEQYASVQVYFQVATDEEFTNITNDGIATASSENDYILKVDASNLAPNTQYYYRFVANGVTSETGTTRTLPHSDENISQVKFAVFSCSNYPSGYFNTYKEATKIDDLDVALHLGDYIYEYRMGEYATGNAERLGRALPTDNDVELIALTDYRKRYALYRTDAALQELHRKVPFIVVPDDHEVANDTYISGAENHSPETEGDFNTRKLNALQAYFEWLPIRPASEGDNATLHRRFQWGNLINLLMLDTRLTGRTEQLPGLADPSWYDENQSFNTQAFINAISDPMRTMLGTDQLGWLISELSTSNATWQVLGQQVLMARMNMPFELLAGFGGDLTTVLTELATIKSRLLQGDPTVTDSEAARVNTSAPYNLDAWDGYQYERETILSVALQQAQNLVVLSGDTHNAWSSNLTTANGSSAGVEFAGSSVTSPGLEDFLSLPYESALALEQALTLLVDDLQYTNLYERGLMVVTFTPEEALSEWLYVDTIESENYTILEPRSVKLKTLAGQNTLMPA